MNDAFAIDIHYGHVRSEIRYQLIDSEKTGYDSFASEARVIKYDRSGNITEVGQWERLGAILHIGSIERNDNTGWLMNILNAVKRRTNGRHT